jgi:hypothetical protein
MQGIHGGVPLEPGRSNPAEFRRDGVPLHRDRELHRRIWGLVDGRSMRRMRSTEEHAEVGRDGIDRFAWNR